MIDDKKKKRRMSDEGESEIEENNFESRTNWISGPADIPKNEIKFENILSEEGGFGVVWRGTCRGTPVAIKVPRGPFTNKQLTDFRKEISILSRLYNPSICLFMGAHIGKDEVIIVSELMEGNVEELLKNKQISLSLYQKLNMCRDGARGIAWLHAQNPKVLHRDIKPSNFLYVKVNESYRIRVCDFGLSDLVPSMGIKEHSPKGTPLYMAPEVLMTKRFNEKADVYSFGVSLWQIITEEDPWKDIEKIEDLIDAVCVKHKRPALPQNCPQSLKKLINICWDPDPANRPSFEQLISEINKIRVEAAIPVDVSGQNFWRKYFQEKGKVKFKEWLQHFFNQYTYLRGPIPEDQNQNIPLSGYIGEISNVVDRVNESNGEIDIQNIKLIFLRLLKTLFVTETKTKEDEDYVDIEHYGRCLGWVGPIEDNPFQFLLRLQRLYAQPWFFGMLPTPEATSLLLPSDTGTYLVRFCNTPNLPGFYVLSVVTTNNQDKKVVAHIRIKHTPGGTFSLEKIPGPEYENLDLLIDDCVKKMRLKKACLGRKYQLTYFETIAKELQPLQNFLLQKLHVSQDMNVSEDN